MNIIELGTINTVQGRTGIKKGDSVSIYFPSKNEGNRLLFSVCRYHKNVPRSHLSFEGGDSKATVEGYECNESGAYLFMMLIAKITGLQARFAHKKANSITFVMQKGDGLITHENDVN